jgi:hypothetical protein
VEHGRVALEGGGRLGLDLGEDDAQRERVVDVAEGRVAAVGNFAPETPLYASLISDEEYSMTGLPLPVV